MKKITNKNMEKIINLNDYAMTYEAFADRCVKEFNKHFKRVLDYKYTDLFLSFTVVIRFEYGEHIKSSYLSRLKAYIEDCGHFVVKRINVMNVSDKYNQVEIIVGGESI